jgi:hypothetical protein
VTLDFRSSGTHGEATWTTPTNEKGALTFECVLEESLESITHGRLWILVVPIPICTYVRVYVCTQSRQSKESFEKYRYIFVNRYKQTLESLGFGEIHE